LPFALAYRAVARIPNLIVIATAGLFRLLLNFVARLAAQVLPLLRELHRCFQSARANAPGIGVDSFRRRRVFDERNFLIG
jgi:hypothetical protein